ncbi:MAG TPA: hypothetical protein DDZ89_13205 [Clostridiales bacterium]|nr:hypothetical protein [Clostridiales bacterium]
MIIRKIMINGFGKYNNKEFVFHKGLNCILGENEAGKTTLLWFIRGMLYGLKGGRTKANGEQAPLKKYQPWSKGPYSGTLEIQTDKGEVFYISRDFDGKNLNIFNDQYVDVTNDLLLSSDMQPGDVFLDMNESCYENTCFIGSSGSGLSIGDRKDVESKLVDVSETGFFDVSLANAISLLEDLHKKEIGVTGDKRAGRDKPLPTVLQRINELDGKLLHYEKIKEEIIILQDALDDVQIQIKVHEEQIALLAAEEEVLDLSTSVSGDLVTIGILKDIALSLGENKKMLDCLKTQEKAYQEILLKLSVFADETAETVKIPGKLFDRERLYRMDYEKALHAINQYDIEKDRLLEQLKKYDAFENNKGDIDTVFDLVRLLPVFDRDAQESIAEKREEQEQEHQLITGSLKKTNTWMVLVVIGLLGFLGMTVWNLFSLIPVVILLLGLIFLLIRKRRLSNKKNHIEKLSSEEITTPETLRFSSTAQQLKDTLRLFSCPTFDFFKRRLSEYKSLLNEIDAITYGQRLQNEAKEEKCELLSDARIKLSQAIAKFKKDETEQAETTLRDIDSGWNEYVHTKMQLDQCSKRKNEVTQAQAGLLSKMREEGYSDFEDLDKALPLLVSNVKKKILYVKEKALHVENPDLKSVVLSLSKMDTRSAGSLLEELSVKNKKERDRIGPIHGELKIKGTKIQRDLEGLWAEYEGYKNATEELLLQTETKEQLLLQEQILHETIRQLKRAGDDVKKNFYQPMSKKLNTYVDIITSGKHNDMKVSEELQVNASGESGIKNVMDFSTGTVEQIFFALRLVCIEMIEGEEKCPVFADEIFASFDDRRALNTLQLLAESNASRQIFLFTCRMREPDMAKQVLPNVNIIRIN